jgi:hypothetical protein
MTEAFSKRQQFLYNNNGEIISERRTKEDEAGEGAEKLD